jgi:hypothetical protein
MLMSVSDVVLVPENVLLALFLKRTASTLSMLMSASNAALAKAFALLVLPRLNNRLQIIYPDNVGRGRISLGDLPLF